MPSGFFFGTLDTPCTMYKIPRGSLPVILIILDNAEAKLENGGLRFTVTLLNHIDVHLSASRDCWGLLFMCKNDE